MSADRAAQGPLLEVEQLRIATASGRTIVHDFSFELEAGESIAIVGESGSGKSVTARAVAGLLPSGLHAEGSVRFRGRELLGARGAIASLRGSELALVPQDPFTSLNPLMRCGQQITDGPRLHRRSRRERHAEAVRRLGEVGIPDPSVVERFPFQLSGGMRQRVALAAALAGDPALVIADEFSTALDVTTQAEILRLLDTLRAARGMSLIMITHDLRMAFSICDRVYVLYAGSELEAGPAAAVEREPKHPYTLGLLLSEPDVRARQGAIAEMPGSVPEADEVAGECAFAARCRWVEPRCREARPALVDVEPGRRSACIRVEQIAAEMRAHRGAARAATADGGASEDAERDVLLEVVDLVKEFPGRGGAPFRALKGVTVTVGRNESVGLVGESGSGKTTLARCAVGLERPSGGAIALDGVDVTDWQRLSAERRTAMRRKIQYVFQDPYSSLNPARTIGATLAEAIRAGGRCGRAEVPARLDALLDLVRLPRAYRERKPQALSGGERQRVAIARALAVQPELIVCDEPVSALDVSVQAQVLNLLAEIQRETGVSYLFISHDLAVIRQIADRVYVLYRGDLVEQGATTQVLDRPQHAYTRELLASVPGAAAAAAGAPAAP